MGTDFLTFLEDYYTDELSNKYEDEGVIIAQRVQHILEYFNSKPGDPLLFFKTFFTPGGLSLFMIYFNAYGAVYQGHIDSSVLSDDQLTWVVKFLPNPYTDEKSSDTDDNFSFLDELNNLLTCEYTKSIRLLRQIKGSIANIEDLKKTLRNIYDELNVSLTRNICLILKNSSENYSLSQVYIPFFHKAYGQLIDKNVNRFNELLPLHSKRFISPRLLEASNLPADQANFGIKKLFKKHRDFENHISVYTARRPIY